MHDKLGDRMKRYEGAHDHVLPPNFPVIIRLDGKNFHAFTRGRFDAPFDPRFKDSMHGSTKTLLELFSNAKIGYVQSDEASLLFDDNSRDNNPFYKNRIQKICSVLASTCAVAFYKEVSKYLNDVPVMGFDCRCFVLPRFEVVNYFIWRQKDATRNAVNSILYWVLREKGLGRKQATKEVEGLSTTERIEKLKCMGIDTDDREKFPVYYLRGSCIKKVEREVEVESLMDSTTYDELVKTGKVKNGQTTTRSSWKIDKKIPLFWKNREYIDRVLTA